MAYATVDDVRRHLGYQDGFSADDDLIADALAAAVEVIDDYCGRSFGSVSTSSARIFDGGTSRCPIDDAATVTLVEHSADRKTWTTVLAADWWTEPANTTPIKVVGSLVPFLPFVRVTGTWGHGATVPSAVSRATVMLAAKLHKRRDSVTGVEGFADFGVVRISNRTDPDIALLLDGYRRADRFIGLA